MKQVGLLGTVLGALLYLVLAWCLALGSGCVPPHAVWTARALMYSG